MNMLVAIKPSGGREFHELIVQSLKFCLMWSILNLLLNNFIGWSIILVHVRSWKTFYDFLYTMHNFYRPVSYLDLVIFFPKVKSETLHSSLLQAEGVPAL